MTVFYEYLNFLNLNEWGVVYIVFHISVVFIIVLFVFDIFIFFFNFFLNTYVILTAIVWIMLFFFILKYYEFYSWLVIYNFNFWIPEYLYTILTLFVVYSLCLFYRRFFLSQNSLFTIFYTSVLINLISFFFYIKLIVLYVLSHANSFLFSIIIFFKKFFKDWIFYLFSILSIFINKIYTFYLLKYICISWKIWRYIQYVWKFRYSHSKRFDFFCINVSKNPDTFINFFIYTVHFFLDFMGGLFKLYFLLSLNCDLYILLFFSSCLFKIITPPLIGVMYVYVLYCILFIFYFFLKKFFFHYKYICIFFKKNIIACFFIFFFITYVLYMNRLMSICIFYRYRSSYSIYFTIKMSYGWKTSFYFYKFKQLSFTIMCIYLNILTAPYYFLFKLSYRLYFIVIWIRAVLFGGFINLV